MAEVAAGPARCWQAGSCRKSGRFRELGAGRAGAAPRRRGLRLGEKGRHFMWLAPLWVREAVDGVAERRVPPGGWRGVGPGLPAGCEESSPEPCPADGK